MGLALCNVLYTQKITHNSLNFLKRYRDLHGNNPRNVLLWVMIAGDILIGHKSTSIMYIHEGRTRSNTCNCNSFKSKKYWKHNKNLRFSHHNNLIVAQSLYLNFEWSYTSCKNFLVSCFFLSNISFHWKTAIPCIMPPLWAIQILEVKFLDSNHPRLRLRDSHFTDFE